MARKRRLRKGKGLFLDTQQVCSRGWTPNSRE